MSPSHSNRAPNDGSIRILAVCGGLSTPEIAPLPKRGPRLPSPARARTRDPVSVSERFRHSANDAAHGLWSECVSRQRRLSFSGNSYAGESEFDRAVGPWLSVAAVITPRASREGHGGNICVRSRHSI